LIADSTSGDFATRAPKLDDGEHVVYIQAVRKKDNAVSKTVKINFRLATVVKADLKNLPKIFASGKLDFQALQLFVSSLGFPWWIILVAIALVIVAHLLKKRLRRVNQLPPPPKT